MASRCEDGTVTGDFLNELPNFHIDTFSELEEHSGRFAEVSESDVEQFIEGEENANTKKKTFYDLKLIKKFLVEERHEIREIEKIPATELDSYLSQFVLAARKKTGKYYEPSSLRGILATVERHLSRSSYGKTIFKDSAFKKTRDVLKAKQKQLKRHGLGNRAKATTALTDDEIEILFDKKLRGLSSPQALLNTARLNNMMHFGLRGCKEQKELRWGEIVLKTDSDGKEYLEYFERQTKTRTGEDPRNQPPIKRRMYANNDAISIDRDPVHVYKIYKEKRPPSLLEPDSSFYLSVNYFKTETRASVEGKNWFKAQPMGVNKLNSIMKDMTQAAGISGKTKHSGRKTLVQKLQDSGVPPNQIIQITGHKNLQSVNNYSSLREKQMESISRILSSTTKAATNVPQTENNLTAQPLADRIASMSTTSSTLGLNSFNENRLQTMFHGNDITGGVFNINLAPAKNELKSPEVDPKRKKRRLIIESDSSQESTT